MPHASGAAIDELHWGDHPYNPESERENDIKAIIKELEKLSIKELKKFLKFGETKEAIATNLYKTGKKLHKQIETFFDHGGKLTVSVPPLVWKILNEAKIVENYS